MQYKVILQLFNIWSLIFTLNLISTAITLAPTLALTLILALTLVDVPTRDAQPCVLAISIGYRLPSPITWLIVVETLHATSLLIQGNVTTWESP
jgi:hypothetical protein